MDLKIPGLFFCHLDVFEQVTQLNSIVLFSLSLIKTYFSSICCLSDFSPSCLPTVFNFYKRGWGGGDLQKFLPFR